MITQAERLCLWADMLMHIKESNMDFKTSRTVMWIGFIAGILIALLGCNGGNEVTNPWLFGIGMVIFIASLLIGFIFYRCPHCGYSLMNVKGCIPKHCPKCGEIINDVE